MDRKQSDEAAERRDAVLRRMLATPKAGKGERKEGEPRAMPRQQPTERRKQIKGGKEPQTPT